MSGDQGLGNDYKRTARNCEEMIIAHEQGTVIALGSSQNSLRH
jgi:hypothetical protein